MASEGCIERVRRVLDTEGAAIGELAAHIGDQGSTLETVCELIRSRCGDPAPGRLVVSGVGKAGLVARKIAATFASTGTPSLFMHPCEARHGDLGMLREQDLALLLSNSGTSDELVELLPSLARIGCPLLAITGRADSPVARHADHHLDIGAVVEACPLGLAPSTSTTVMLALGDALALAVLEARAFTPEQYARFHPAGALGRRLMTCRQAMRRDDRLALVGPETPVSAVLRAITAARAGSALLVDADRHLLGIFTDGDLRRILAAADDPGAVLAAPVRAHATMPCTAIDGDELLQSALHCCAERRFDELPVIDADGRAIGLIDLQDLADRGFDV